MHLDTETLQRLLHHELAAGDEPAVRAHLAECADCHARFEAAAREEAEILALLGRLDHPLPAADPLAIMRRAGGGAAWLRRLAASIVLLAGVAGAAYAMPGSPVRAWVAQLREWVAGPRTVPPPLAPEARPGATGIAVSPGERLLVEFIAEQDSGAVDVRLGPGPDLMLTALGPGVAFVTREGRLTVDNRGSRSSYALELPRDAARIEVRVGGRLLLRMEGSRLELIAPADSAGSYHLPLTPGATR